MYKKSVIGYSGHEMNLASSVAAVVLGARIIERHITLDKSMGELINRLLSNL